MYALDLDKYNNQHPHKPMHCRAKNTHLALILEANLPYRHATIFLQVTPWCIHNGDVIFLVSFNTVCLGQLRTVDQQILVHLLPVFAFWEPHVDVG